MDLATEPVAALVFAAILALAADGEGLAGHHDLNIFRLDAGQIDANDQLAIRHEGFEGGVKHPIACPVGHPAAEPPVEQFVDIPAEAIQLRKHRRPHLSALFIIRCHLLSVRLFRLPTKLIIIVFDRASPAAARVGAKLHD